MSELRYYGFAIQVDQGDSVTKVRQFRSAVADSGETVDALKQKLGQYGNVTVDVVKSTKELELEARAVVREQARQDKKTREVIQQYQRLNQTVKTYGNDLETVNAITRLGSSATDAQRNEVAQLVRQYQEARKTGDAARGSMRRMRGAAQNFGWQLQDTVVQLQMGTNWMTVLSQQGSQMASSFGIWGALAGAGIAVVGAVMPAVIAHFSDAKKGVDDLNAATKELNDVLNTSGFTVDGVTQQLYELYKVDQQLAKLRLVSAMQTAQRALQEYQSQIKDTLGETLSSVTQMQNVVKQGDISDSLLPQNAQAYQTYLANVNSSLDSQAKSLGITRDQLLQLAQAYDTFKASGDDTNLRDILTDLGTSSQKLSPELSELVSKYVDLAAKGALTKRQLEELQEIFENGIDIGNAYNATTESTAQRYQTLRDQLGLTEEQLALYNYQHSEEYRTNQSARESTENLIRSYFEEKRAIDANTQATKNAIEAEKEANKERERTLNRLERRIDRSPNGFEDPMVKEERRNNEILKELYAQRAGLREDDYQNQVRIDKLIQDEGKRHSKAMEKSYVDLAKQQVQVLSGVSDMITDLADAFATGVDDIRDQMDGMTEFQKAAFLVSQGIAAANALVNGWDLGMKMAAMWGNPAMVSVGVGLGAASAGAIMGTTFAGAFDNGGYIPGGQMGITSEYGDELVNGVMVKGPARVTSREDTAKMMNSGGGTGLNISIRNEIPDAAYEVNQLNEKDVEIIATRVMNQKGDKMVASAINKKGSKTDKSMRANYKGATRLL